MKNDYIPLTIHGEDVIVDYQNKELVFPNRQENNKSDYDKAAAISCYLKAEGYLDFDLMEKNDE